QAEALSVEVEAVVPGSSLGPSRSRRADAGDGRGGFGARGATHGQDQAGDHADQDLHGAPEHACVVFDQGSEEAGGSSSLRIPAALPVSASVPPTSRSSSGSTCWSGSSTSDSPGETSEIPGDRYGP